MTESLDAAFQQAVAFLREADGLLITAGAGMGVDSGLPDFRGTDGFWNVYPALRHAGLKFTDIARPYKLVNQPRLFWGFYGHRLKLYRETIPHEGFHLLRKIAGRMPNGAFVITSNVDGQFQKAGFDPSRISEIHGSIHHLQCMNLCNPDVWPADEFIPEVDDQHCRLTSQIPWCPYCGVKARPNILMFDDWYFSDERKELQKSYFNIWRSSIQSLVVIELGAGMAISSIRNIGDRANGPLIRINPTEARVSPNKGVGLQVGALQGMREIAKLLSD